MKIYIEKFLDLVLRWILSHRKIKPTSRCPACGNRDGNTIKYDPGTKRVFTLCGLCSALWPRMPVVPSHVWDLVGRELDQAQQYETDLTSLFSEKKKTSVEEKK